MPENRIVTVTVRGTRICMVSPPPEFFLLVRGNILIPLVGFLPASDPRVRGTLQAIEDKLLIDQEFVLRYETENSGDGLPPGEGAFLAKRWSKR